MDRQRFGEVLGFLIKLNLLAIPMYLVIWSGAQAIPLQVFVKDVSYKSLKLAGFDVSNPQPASTWFWISSGSSREQINIDLDCTGWKSMFAIAALMVATPLALDRKKLGQIALAVGGIFLLNVVRIVTTLSFSATFGLEYLEIVHTVLWREGMIAAVVAIWAFWAYSRRGEIVEKSAGGRKAKGNIAKKRITIT
jgi:exosortase/archaeosortase family protein